MGANEGVQGCANVLNEFMSWPPIKDLKLQAILHNSGDKLFGILIFYFSSVIPLKMQLRFVRKT